MALYSYRKQIFGPKKTFLVAISYISMTLGSLFLFWSFYPVLASEFYTRVFLDNSVKAAVTDNVTSAVEKANLVQGTTNKFSTNLVDYSKASNWFVSPNVEQFGPEELGDIKEYVLDIPKIGISNARVVVNGEDLFGSVVHYLARTLPGKRGKVSLFGHSSLLQLYKPNNYEHIFSYVPFLEKGDVIYVTMQGAKYTYEVYDKIVVKPEEVDVLDQQYDDAYLDLITCVPHGTYLKRAVIKAKLKQLGS
ncbi:sortase [Candidatus Dojkabacteria bacterium]|uniref:Sortase n=1 Tax=Candidatus Dojkabacteria bacterium TaxID=2099670 RepID=A0A5C7J3N8_9BACT|nr:MAG: sortase [Candidatus Dojkabacteria bacterium]